MSVAYDRAIKNVPDLMRSGKSDVAIEAMARGLATEWSEALLSNLPDGDNPDLDVQGFVTDYLSAENNDYRVAIASLLGWAAGFTGEDPVRFTETHSPIAEATFAAQLGAEVENVIENRSPAEMPARSAGLAEFFKSDDMGAFLEEHAIGETPWSASLDGSGRIVLANSDRSTFYTLTTMDVPGGDDQFWVLRYNDAMDVIDPHSEKWIEVALADTPQEALHAFMVDAELVASAPSP